jgi:hypothetical protein
MKQLPWWGKAAISVILAGLAFAGLKEPVLKAVCSEYNIEK